MQNASVGCPRDVLNVPELSPSEDCKSAAVAACCSFQLPGDGRSILRNTHSVLSVRRMIIRFLLRTSSPSVLPGDQNSIVVVSRPPLGSDFIYHHPCGMVHGLRPIHSCLNGNQGVAMTPMSCSRMIRRLVCRASRAIYNYIYLVPALQS